jgi:6-pyruvoyl-tetrahydropterin synthase
MTEENSEYTVGEFEDMDLSPLHGHTFMVAVSTGPRDKAEFICGTICGPLDFYEMVEAVGTIYEQEQLHAKAFIPSKTFGKKPQVLDENTIDFIEARYLDIIADGLLGGGVLETKNFTCKAGFIVEEEVAEATEQDTSP